MPDFDRHRLIEVLGQLGDGQDETALAAAREASRLVAESGRGWGELIVSAEAAVSSGAAVPARSKDADSSDSGKVVERLLARTDISDTLRSDLKDFKRAIAEGTLDKTDADYLRALAKRLGA